jgi:hypothetical protein
MPTLLTLPVELRYQIFDLLAPPCEALTIGTISVHPETYAEATCLAAQNDLSADSFIWADPVVAAGKNTYTLADQAPLVHLIPEKHLLVVCTGHHKAPLDFTDDGEKRHDFSCNNGRDPFETPFNFTHQKDRFLWTEGFHLAVMVFTCRQLRAEVNRYLEMVPGIREATLHVSYPLGLVATREVLPGLLSRARRVDLAGFYNPYAKEAADGKKNAKMALGHSHSYVPPLPLATYERAARVVDELVARLVDSPASSGGQKEQAVADGRDGHQRNGTEHETPVDTSDICSTFTSTIRRIDDADSPLTLRFYVPPGYIRPADACLAAPCPYASVARAPHASAGFQSRAKYGISYAWIISAARGRPSTSTAPPTWVYEGRHDRASDFFSACLKDFAIAGDRMFSSELDVRGVNRQGPWRPDVPRTQLWLVEQAARKKATSLWLAAARDGVVRPRVSFATAVDVAWRAIEEVQSALHGSWEARGVEERAQAALEGWEVGADLEDDARRAVGDRWEEVLRAAREKMDPEEVQKREMWRAAQEMAQDEIQRINDEDARHERAAKRKRAAQRKKERKRRKQ